MTDGSRVSTPAAAVSENREAATESV